MTILAMTTADNHGDNDGDNHDHDGVDYLFCNPDCRPVCAT